MKKENNLRQALLHLYVYIYIYTQSKSTLNDKKAKKKKRRALFRMYVNAKKKTNKYNR
jgi:hypothetical protein